MEHQTPIQDLSQLADLGRRARQQEELERLARVERLRERTAEAAAPDDAMHMCVGIAVFCLHLPLVYVVLDTLDIATLPRWMWYASSGTAFPMFLLAWLVRPSGQRVLAAELARIDQLPFPVRGYHDWIPASDGRIVIELAAQPPAALLRDVLASASPAAQATWLAPHRISLKLPAKTLTYGDDTSDIVGDILAFRRLSGVLEALHATYPIERVEMHVV